MRKVFILAFFTVWMFSCSEAPQVQTDSLGVDCAIVDTVVPQQSDTIAKVADTVQTELTYTVAFKVQFTRDYCGGARPNEEIITEYNSPIALVNSTLKLKNHFTGKEYFLNTGTSGTGTLDLEEGKYDIFFTKTIDPNLPTGFDPKCGLWRDQLLQTVKISGSNPQASISVHFICNPCDSEMKKRP